MKTPLYYVDHHGFRNVYDADDRLICDNDFDGNDPQYAARIVACVNACAGMDDPEAEIATLRSLVQTIPTLTVDYQRMARLEAALGCIASDRGDHPAVLIAKGALNP